MEPNKTDEETFVNNVTVPSILTNSTEVTAAEAPVGSTMLRPFFTLFGASWNHVMHNFSGFLPLVGILILIYGISFSANVIPVFIGDFIRGFADQFTWSGMFFDINPIYILLSAVFALIILAIGQIGLIMPMISVMGKTPLPLRTVIRQTKTLFWPLVITTLFFVSVYLGSMLFLLIPFIALMVYLMPIYWVFFLEGHRNRAAVERAIDLTAGRFWAVTGRWALFWLFGTLIAFGGILLFGLIGLVLLPLFMVSTTVGLVVGLIGAVVGFMFLIVAMLVSFRFSFELYQDLVATESAVEKSPRPFLVTRGAITVYLAIGSVLTALVLLSQLFSFVGYFDGSMSAFEDPYSSSWEEDPFLSDPYSDQPPVDAYGIPLEDYSMQQSEEEFLNTLSPEERAMYDEMVRQFNTMATDTVPVMP